MDWIDLSENRNRWWDLINAVMNSLASIKCGEFVKKRDPL